MRNFIEQRQVLFQKMARIDQMEYGSLKAEYRPGADPEHPLGPYYKYQVWQDGKNRSERVADPRAEQLRKALEGRQHFEQLARECIELTVQHTRQGQTDTDAKKTPGVGPPGNRFRSPSVHRLSQGAAGDRERPAASMVGVGPPSRASERRPTRLGGVVQ
jgi:hypothetical protein